MSEETQPTWLSKETFCQTIGVPESTIKGWQARHWINGKHYQVIGHTTLVNTEEVNLWITTFGQNISDHIEMDSVSGFDMAEKQSRPQLRAKKAPKVILKEQ